MADGPSIGTAYLRVAGDFSQVNSQMVGLVKADKFSKLGKIAGAGLVAGVAAAGIGKALYEVGKEFDAAYDTIRTQTGATGKELEKLKGNFRNVVRSVPVDFDTASKAVAGLSQRLELTGRPLNQLSKQITELSRITGTDVTENVESITRLFGDWGIKTKDQTKTLDQLFRVTQETGIGLSDLSRMMVDFGSPMRQLGLDFDFGAAMFARFEKEGVNIQTLMPGLRFALKSFSGGTAETTKALKEWGISLKDPSVALQDVFQLLEDAPSDLEANAIAFKVFGQRAGPDMAAAVREGRFELDELMKTVQDGDDTVRKAGRSTMDFSEHWLKFKNNVLLALEPVATRVFEGVGDAMKDVTKIIADPKLTSGEKLQKLSRLVLGAVGDLAAKVGEKAPMIALELVKGFLNAPVLGQLVLGGLLLKKLGGAKGFQTLGRNLGSRLGAGLAIGLALALPQLVVQAYKLGRKIGEVIDDAIPSLADMIRGKVDVTDVISPRKLIDTGNLEAATEAFEHMGLSAQQARERVHDVQMDLWRDDRQRERSAEQMSQSVRNSWEGIARGVGRSSDEAHDRGGRNLRGLADDMDRHTRRGGQAMGENVEGASRKVVDELSRAKRGGKESTFDLAKGVALNIGALAGAVGAGMLNVQTNTNKSLEAFGVKALKFAIEGVGNLFAGAQRNQLGGVIVPGFGSGDKVPALLEPGELVINREAVAALGGAQKADAINRMIPRFATGGMVDPAGPGTGVVNAAIAGVVGAWSKRYNAAINYGYDPGGGHVSPGHNVTGTATDTGPAGGWGAGPTRLFETGLRAILGKVDQILYGSHGVGTPYPNHGWGNHAHIEWGMHPDVQGAVQAKIAQQILKGPAGPLKDMGQKALDKVRGAAQKYIGKRMGMSGGPDIGSFGSPGLYSLSELVKLWTTVNDGLGNAGTMARIALAESSGDPRAVGNDPGGTTGLGLWQITTGFNDDIIARYGGRNAMFVPSKNAAAAAAIFRRQGLGAWDASSANWQTGGIVQRLARGGRVNWSNFTGPGTGGGGGGHGGGGGYQYTGPFANWGGYSSLNQQGQYTGPFAGWGGGGGGGGGALPAVSRPGHDPLSVLSALFTARETAEKLEEQVGVAEIVDAFYSSPSGQDLSPAERAGQVALNTDLLGWRTWQRDLAKLSLTLFPSSSNLYSDFLSEINDIQGATGAGGWLLDIRRRLDDLNAPVEADGTVSQDALDALRADLLGEQLAEARRSNAILRQQMPVFEMFRRAPFGGSFHEGGTVPGPVGQDRMILAQGGERVSKRGSTINVYVDPVSLDTRVEEIVDGRLVQVVRGAATRGGVTGSKAGHYG